MTPPTTLLRGRCHCGNIEVTFESNLALDRLPVRACTCSFCTAHGARNTSDPNGRVALLVHDASELTRYRFGLKTADFLVCRKCGVYIGAVLADGEARYASINLNTIAAPDDFAAKATPVSYDHETEADRRSRRKRAWTPVVSFVAS